MVIDQVSPAKIRSYLDRWLRWWVNASNVWAYDTLLKWFLEYCWDENLAVYAKELLQQYIKKSCASPLAVQLQTAVVLRAKVVA